MAKTFLLSTQTHPRGTPTSTDRTKKPDSESDMINSKRHKIAILTQTQTAETVTSTENSTGQILELGMNTYIHTYMHAYMEIGHVLFDAEKRSHGTQKDIHFYI